METTFSAYVISELCFKMLHEVKRKEKQKVLALLIFVVYSVIHFILKACAFCVSIAPFYFYSAQNTPTGRPGWQILQINTTWDYRLLPIYPQHTPKDNY